MNLAIAQIKGALYRVFPNWGGGWWESPHPRVNPPVKSTNPPGSNGQNNSSSGSHHLVKKLSSSMGEISPTR